eukprot:403354189
MEESSRSQLKATAQSKNKVEYEQTHTASVGQGFGDQEFHENIPKRWQQFYIWVLFLNHISAQWQTYLFVYLANGDDKYTNIKEDLDLSGETYALVTGTVFTLVNSVFGLLMGYFADRYNRKWLLFPATVLWTLMTLSTAFTHNFWEVLIPRIGFSFFMSACIPVSVSLINDYFEHEQRGRANSLFAFGIYLGGGLSSLSLILDQKTGQCDQFSIFSTDIVVQRAKKSAIIEVIASTLRFFGGYAIGFWSPTFFQGRYPDYVQEYSICNAFVVIVGGLTSSYTGGWITDKYEDRYPRIKGYISGFGALVSCVFIILTYTAQINFWVSMVGLFLAYLTAEMWYGPAHAAVNRIFPSEFQGLAIAIFTLFGASAGALATYLLGLIGDKFQTKDYPERSGYCLTAFVLFSYCTCCPMFIWASIEYEKMIKGRQEKEKMKLIESQLQEQENQNNRQNFDQKTQDSQVLSQQAKDNSQNNYNTFKHQNQEQNQEPYSTQKPNGSTISSQIQNNDSQ